MSMYCPKCGTERKEENNFCSICGYNFLTRDNPQAAMPVPVSTQTSDSKKVVKIILIIVGCILAFFIILALLIGFGIYFLITNIGKQEYIDVGYELVPSIYEVTGNYYKVCNIRSSSMGLYNSNSIKEITYCDSLDEDDVEEYRDYLLDEEFFEEEDDHLIKNSDSFKIIVDIEGKTISYYVEYNDDYGFPSDDDEMEEIRYGV